MQAGARYGYNTMSDDEEIDVECVPGFEPAPTPVPIDMSLLVKQLSNGGEEFLSGYRINLLLVVYITAALFVAPTESRKTGTE